MKHRLIPRRAVAAMLVCLIAASAVSCRRTGRTGLGEYMPDAMVAPELMTNQLGTLPGSVYQSQARSPIRWQPWTKDTMERAREARRLVFCVIAMPQHAGFTKVLKALESNGDHVNALNNEYVPVLVDGDAARDMSIITSDLCAEIKRPLQLPLFLWMTHEANPVAWIPVHAGDAATVSTLFLQSHTMVSQMWRDDPAYVINNSRLDNVNRRNRLQNRQNVKVMSKEPAADLLRGLRQLNSLYDPLTRNFDETGGLIPTSSLELLASAAAHPGLPGDLRGSCMKTVRSLVRDLMGSAMFDPLDGGLFSARRGQSWTLPNFTKDCITQARFAGTLLEVGRVMDDPDVKERALGLIAYCEKHYATPEGLFAIGFMPPTRPEAWMWNVEEIRELLGPQDAEWWIKATGMKGLGNLPSEVDPLREYFRENTLSLPLAPSKIAVENGFDPREFEPRFHAAREKLLAARNQRLGRIPRDESANAGATLRMVSAYAAAFRATGDADYRGKAVKLLQRARERFSDGARLRAFSADVPAAVGAARNFHYALALQAALDVAAITSDETWLVWSEDLATTAAELFTGQDVLKECPDEINLMNLPISDLVMLFDDSTAGLISMAECRLARIGRPLVDTFSELATPLPTYAPERPVLHTDLFLAALARHFSITAVHGADLAPAMKLAVERLPLRMVQRRAASEGENVPPGAVELHFGVDGRKMIVETPDALERAIMPADGSTEKQTATPESSANPVQEP